MAHGGGGDWIVKLPDQRFAGVPRVEHARMTFAAAVGLEVVELLTLDDLDGLPPLPHLAEHDVFAIRRYDRTPTGRVHQEDLAQVLGLWPEQKYERANYETIANVMFRVAGPEALSEFVRRLGNGDAHLKNWSLLEDDGRNARLSPAYDLISTVLWMGTDALALNLARSKSFQAVDLDAFRRMGRRIGVGTDVLADLAAGFAAEVRRAWSQFPWSLTDAQRTRLDAHLASVPLFRSV